MSATAILRLKSAFNDQQAEALAGLFDEHLATKTDIEGLRESTRLEIEKLRADLDHKLEMLRADVQRDLAKNEAHVAQTIMRYQVGGVLSIGVLLALFRVIG
jgi:hypothetical protein